MTRKELDKIIERHQHWLEEDCDGWEKMRANLHNADLSGADLHNVNLYGAKLSGTDLSYANLYGTDLSYANLYGTKTAMHIPLACPEAGSFIAWKKASDKIIKLMVPEDAKRSSATTNKCRCDKAIVLEIQNVDGTKSSEKTILSNYDKEFIYEVGKTVSVSDFDENRWNECSAGIHFFVDRQSAVNYNIKK